MNGFDVYDEFELSMSLFIKCVDNFMGVSFRVESFVLFEVWRGIDGGVKIVDDSWCV